MGILPEEDLTEESDSDENNDDIKEDSENTPINLTGSMNCISPLVKKILILTFIIFGNYLGILGLIYENCTIKVGEWKKDDIATLAKNLKIDNYGDIVTKSEIEDIIQDSK